MSLGILFPGQGSQSIGMLKDLKSSFKVVSEIFESFVFVIKLVIN